MIGFAAAKCQLVYAGTVKGEHFGTLRVIGIPPPLARYAVKYRLDLQEVVFGRGLRSGAGGKVSNRQVYRSRADCLPYQADRQF